MTNLQNLLNERSADIDKIAAHLDSLDNQARTREALSLGRKEQKRLFDLAAGRALDLNFFVPEETPPMQEVVHEGEIRSPSSTISRRSLFAPIPALTTSSGAITATRHFLSASSAPVILLPSPIRSRARS